MQPASSPTDAPEDVPGTIKVRRRCQTPERRPICRPAQPVLIVLINQSIKCPRSTFEPEFMQHYQVPSAEYSSYINHVISLGLAQDYMAQPHARCSSNSTPHLRAAINQACRHLFGVVDDLQLETGCSQCQYLSMECPVKRLWASRMVHQSQTQQLAWQQPCLTLLRRKLVSYGSPSLTMPVMVQLSHRTQFRLRNQLPSPGG